MTTVGRRIQRERRSRGWTQAQLASRVPIGQQTVSRWERDLTTPTGQQIGRLIEVFGLDPDQPFALPSSAALRVSAQPRPSGRPLVHELPLWEMHWADFERFCGMLVRLLHPSATVHPFGNQGDRQGGIDLYAEKADGTITTFQCKKYRPSTGFGPARVRAAMTANTHQAAGHIILLSCPATAPARIEVMGIPGWDIWDSGDIANFIREKLDPDAQIQLIDRFFPGHRKDFLGIDEPGPWLTAERFFLPSDDPMALVNHTGPLVGHQDITGRLTAFCSGDGRDRVAILSGAGGSGKTRVLKVVADAFPQGDSPIRIRFLSPHASAQPGHVEQLPGEQAVLVIDDAHATPDLEILFGAIATQRPQLRIIAATRPYGVARIRGLAQRAGLADQPLEIPVPQLALPEATALAEQVLARAHPHQDAAHIARGVAALTYDSPLATVLTAELVNRRRIPVQSVSGDPGFRQRVAAAFEDVLTGGLGDPRDADKIEELVEFFALLQPLVPDHGSFDELLQMVLGRSRDDLRRPMAALQAAGVLLLRQGRMWLVPDALADVIAEQACFDPMTGRPSGYADRLFGLELQGVGLPLRNLLVNIGKLDWRLSGGPGGPSTGLLDHIWHQVSDRLRRASHSAQRAALLQAIAEVAYYQPRRALLLARAAVEDVQTGVTDSDPVGVDLLAGELVKILRNAAYTYEEAPAACELLWTLAKIHLAGNHASSAPAKALREIAAYGPGKPVQYHQEILETALAWLDDPGEEADPSPFDVLDMFLATEASESEYGEDRVTIRSFTVEPGVVRSLRNRVVDAAVATVRAGTTRQAVRALKTLESALCQPTGPADCIADIRRSWEADLLRVLRLLRDLAGTPLDPLLYTEIRQIVRWHASHGDPAVRRAARAVLAAVPDTLQVRLTRCLVEGSELSWACETTGPAGASPDGANFIGQTAHELIQATPDTTAAVTVLRECTRTITSVHTGRQPAPGPFTDALIRLRPDIGEVIIDDVVADRSSPLTVILSAVMESLCAASPDKAVVCARKLLALGDGSIDLQVARAYGLGPCTTISPTADEIALIEELARHPAPGVRSMIALAAQRIMQTDRPCAIRLLLGIDFTGNSRVAANVLFQLTCGSVGLDAFPVLGRIALLNQLASCPDIAAHPIEMFLEQIAPLHPDELIAMLMTRIDRSQNHDWDFNQTLPFAWEQRASSPVCLHDHPRLDQLLGTLLDWLATTAGRATVLGAGTVTAVAGTYDDTVIIILQSWLQAHLDRRGVETVASCLRTAPASVLLDQGLFVASLLDSAGSFGPDCLTAVRKGLFQAGISSMQSSGYAHTLAAQAELRDGARHIAAQIPPRSPARAFYRDLAEHADQMSRWASAL